MIPMSHFDFMRNVVVAGSLAKLLHIQERFDLAEREEARYRQLLTEAQRQLPSRARRPEWI